MFLGRRPPRKNHLARRWKGRPEPEACPKSKVRGAVLTVGAYCGAWWETRREKVYRGLVLVLLAVALAAVVGLVALRPAAEWTVRYLSARHPFWWFAVVGRAIARSARGLPWWAEALVDLFVALPLALAAAVAAVLALALACGVALLGVAAEEAWLPRLASAWENRTAAREATCW